MNKKGSLYFTIALVVFVWISGILLLPFIMDDIDTFRINMSCSSSTISNITKLVCLSVDGLVPYFIIILAGIALGYFVPK